MKNEIAEKIIQKSFAIVEKFVEDKEEYVSDIYWIYDNIKELELLMSLLEQEQMEYSEERTIKIANILFEASKLPLINNGLHYTYPDSAFKQKPALYFYERAAENGSIRAMGEVASLLRSGCGNIKKDLKRSDELRKYAAEHGDLSSLLFSEYSKGELKRMAKKGNIMAYIALFCNSYKKGRKIFAKSNLKKFLKVCSQQQKNDVVEWMNDSCLYDYTSVVGFITGKSTSFKIVKPRYI